MSNLLNPQPWVNRLTHLPSLKSYLEPFVQRWQPYWRANGFLSQVIDVREELKDVFTLVVRPSKRWPGFKAGQHVEINLFKNGVRYSRFFSISSSPAYYFKTGLIELSIREQAQGKITPILKNFYAQGGANALGKISLGKAQGEFLLPPSTQPTLLIAGGSGITPFRSMLQQHAYSNSSQPVQLLYFAKNAEQHLFQQELQQLQQQHPTIKVTLLNDQQHGFISPELLQQHCPMLAEQKILICGPAPMIAATQEALAELDVPTQNIQLERFNAAPINQPKAQQDNVQVSFAKSTKMVELLGNSAKSLLQVAEDNGLNPLSGCRAGVCHQCVCQKTSGRVFNTLTGEYSDTGRGEVQLCVSVAVSDLVLEI